MIIFCHFAKVLKVYLSVLCHVYAKNLPPVNTLPLEKCKALGHLLETIWYAVEIPPSYLLFIQFKFFFFMQEQGFVYIPV